MKSLFFLTLALIAAIPAEAQCVYNFCGGAVTNPDTMITSPTGETAPCSLVQLGINLGYVNAEQCLGLPDIEKICCPDGGSTGGTGGSATQSCFICGSDATFNKEKSWDGQKICAALDSLLTTSAAGEACENAKKAGSLKVDMPSYCECPGAAAPGICKFCDDSQEVNQTAMFPNKDGVTCSAGSDYAINLKDSTECSAMVTDAVKAACCVAKSSAISLSMSNFVTALLVVGLAFAF